MKKWTKSKDDAHDKKHGIKEGSKKDNLIDRLHGVKGRKKRAMNFKSKGAYQKWLAYDKMHVSKKPSKNPVKVSIKGKSHKVSHKTKKRGVRPTNNSPFGKISTDKAERAGQPYRANVLSKKSKQNRLDTGKSLLKKAMGKVRRSEYRRGGR